MIFYYLFFFRTLDICCLILESIVFMNINDTHIHTHTLTHTHIHIVLLLGIHSDGYMMHYDRFDIL